MVRKKLVPLVFLSFPAFAQVTSTPDGRGITMKADVFLHYDTQGSKLTSEQFKDSISTQRYILGTEFRNDTMRLFLKSKKPDIVGKKLPDVEWKTFTGNIVRYGETDKITLLSFWSVTCKPCIEEFNELNAWATAYPDVRIIAITTDSASAVLALMEMHNLSWENITIVPEYKGDFNDIFRVHAWPTNIVTDNRQFVRKVLIGNNKSNELMDYMSGLLCTQASLNLVSPNGIEIAKDIQSLKSTASAIVNAFNKGEKIEFEITNIDYAPVTVGFAAIIKYRVDNEGERVFLLCSKGANVQLEAKEMWTSDLTTGKSDAKYTGAFYSEPGAMSYHITDGKVIFDKDDIMIIVSI